MNAHLLSAAHTGGSSNSVAAFVFTIAIAYGCGVVAQRKGRSQLIWFLFGIFLNIVALVTILLMPHRRASAERETLNPDDTPREAGQMLPLELRHARTVAFPTRHIASAGNGDSGGTDEIEAWLKTQRPPAVG
jgi:hypothetical protein